MVFALPSLNPGTSLLSKKPWCHSSRYKALGQMLVTNQWLDKLATVRVNFVSCGMLDPKNPQPPSLVSVSIIGREKSNRVEEEEAGEEEEEEQPVAGPSGSAQVSMITGNVTLAWTRSVSLLLFCLSFY